MSDEKRTRPRPPLFPFPLSLFPLLAAASLAAAGEVHRWKDADGRVHYGDKPPAGVAAKPVAVPASGPAAKPNPEVTVAESVIRHYDIAGNSVAELNMGVQRAGPVSAATGARVWGVCTWKVTWSYATGGAPGKCVLTRLSVKLDAVIDLPRWTNRGAGPPALQAEWDRFIVALRQHEDGHKDNGVRAANDLANRLRALPPEKDCAVLDAKVRALGERVIDQHRLADQAYDRSTGHGATQGATLK